MFIPNQNLTVTTYEGNIIPFVAISYISFYEDHDGEPFTIAHLRDGRTVKLCRDDQRKQISLLLRMNVSFIDFQEDQFDDQENDDSCDMRISSYLPVD